jgi:3-dehydroquinate dehydratase II
MKKIILIHGPNLNLLGMREPGIYGNKTLDEINKDIFNKASLLNVDVDIFQSNHEGEIVDYLHKNYGIADGIIINPGGLTHYSIVLRDALLALMLPIIEVHISNIYQREDFRHISVIAPIAVGQICGLGPDVYLLALESMTNIFKRGSY